MQQLIQMDKDQEQTIEVLLSKIDMVDYLPYFQMLINGEISPADVLKLLITFYHTGYGRGFSAAYEAERAKLIALETWVNELGEKSATTN